MPRAGWLAVGAVIGASAGASDSAPLLVSAWTAALVVLGVAVWRRHAAAAAAAVGVVLIILRVGGGLAADGGAPSPAVPPGDLRSWTAEVVSLGSAAGGEQRASLRIPAGPWLVYGWLPRYPSVVPGDVVTFQGRLDAATSEGGFGEFLARGGYAATTRVRAFSVESRTDGLAAAVEPLRRRAGDLLALALPSPQAGLAAGILIGLRDLVDRDVASDFTTAGLSHVVAISGWNIALVGAVVAAALHRLDRRRRSIVVVAAIVLYTVLAGASASVVRAAVMGAIVLIARESGRRGTAATALGLAVVAVLSVAPQLISDIGLQLSVAATAGLIAWGAPMAGAVARRAPRSTPAWVVEALGVSLAAQAATLPLVLLHFGRLSLVAPLANLLVAPLVAPVMFLSLAGMVAGWLVSVGVAPLAVAPIVAAGTVGLGAMIVIGDIAAALPLASITLPPPADIGAAAAVGLVLLVRGTPLGRRLTWIVPRRRSAGSRPAVAAPSRPGARAASPMDPGSRGGRRTRASGVDRRTAGGGARRAAAATLVTVAVVVTVVSVTRPDGRLTVTVLDVGQGDAILIQGPRGGRMLVDGGPDPDRLLRVLDARLAPWDRRLDLVVLTHPHEDHVAGLPLLLARYRVSTVAEPGMLGSGPGYAAFAATLDRHGTRRLTLGTGDRLALDGATIDVRWPRAGGVPRRAADDGTAVNNVSIVLDVRLGARRFLLNGDAEEEVDPSLIAAGAAAAPGERIDLLKVAHHGSATATTEAFVAATRPRIAIASAGSGNRYGHPSPLTLSRLADAGSRVYRTDHDGSVTVSTDGHDLRVAASGGRPVPTPRMTAAAFTDVAVARSEAVIGTGTSGAAILCGIPLGPVPVAPGTSRSAPGPPVGAPTRWVARSEDPAPDRDDRRRYDGPDVGAVTRPGRAHPDRPAATAVVRPSRERRGRGRRVPRRADRRSRHRGGAAARRGRGPPP